MDLVGRDAELAATDALVAAVRAGGSRALVLRGDPGIGKTALLDHAATADGVRVLRVTAVESEAELPFAGLHLLLHPALSHLPALPAVQADALRAALGLSPTAPEPDHTAPEPDHGTSSPDRPAAGPDRPAAGPDRFLVGLAVLSLLAELAEDKPLLVLVDDAHWLDRASAEALLFAARRLDTDGIGILLTARPLPPFPTPNLPELPLAPLAPADAAALLATHAPHLPPAARRHLLTEAAGNPLALLELPLAEAPHRATSPLGGAFGGAAGMPLTERLRAAFQAQVRRQPAPVQALLLVAALEETGDPVVVLRAAEQLRAAAGGGPAEPRAGAGMEELDAAVRAGLLRAAPDGRLVFHHSLVRAAVAQDAPPGRRLAAHAALAAALTDPHDADRRAWHLASATTGPDERVAAELERTAAWAGERSGHAAAAGAYERAAQLTTDPAIRLRRLTRAAQAAAEAGDLARSDLLATQAERTFTHDLDADTALAARLTAIRAGAAFWRGQLSTAHGQLMRGAELIGAADPHRAAGLLIEAAHTAWYTGEKELTATVDQLRATTLPDTDPYAPFARLMLLATEPIVGAATSSDAGAGGSPDEVVARARRMVGEPAAGILVAGVALIVGQDAVAAEVAGEQVAAARRDGRVGWLPQALFYRASAQVFAGWHREAAEAAAEGVAIARDTDQRQWTDRLGEPRAYLAALAGDEGGCRELTDGALHGVADPGWEVPWVFWALALLDLGQGRAGAALDRLAPLAGGRRRFHIPATRSTPDLVEAAVRVGRPEVAAEPFAQYRRWARHCRQPWIDAVVLRCEALLGPDAEAGGRYERALDGYQRLHRPFERARTALLYGEWLRRNRRRADARGHLRAALEAFERLGAAPWADRARTELGATGTAVPAGQSPADGALAALTPQEQQIVRLAARGLSNKDIAAQLFLSPRTVGYHLYKAYPKLGVLSRGELGALDL